MLGVGLNDGGRTAYLAAFTRRRRLSFNVGKILKSHSGVHRICADQKELDAGGELRVLLSRL